MTDAQHAELLTQIEMRDVNEWICETKRSFGSHTLIVRYRCECGDAWCNLTVGLTDAEYESVRVDGTRFVVALNHERPDERVVSERQRFAVVCTIDAWASRAAREADARSAPRSDRGGRR